jgi:uncharacterized protein (UPF0333 family)
MNFNKKTILLISALLLLVAVIFIVAVLFYTGIFSWSKDKDLNSGENTPSLKEGQENHFQNKETSQNEKSINDAYQRAITSGSTDPCQDIREEQTKHYCVMNIAIMNNNKDQCQGISNDDVRTDCLNKVLLKEMKEKTNKETTECLEMQTKEYTNKCISNIINSIEDTSQLEKVCQGLSGENEKYCLHEKRVKSAILEQDLSACQDISPYTECIIILTADLDIKNAKECEVYLNGPPADYCKERVSLLK